MASADDTQYPSAWLSMKECRNCDRSRACSRGMMTCVACRDTRPVTSPAKLQSSGCALQPTLASVCDAMSSRPARFTRRAHTPAPSDTWRNMVPPAAVSAHAQNAEVFARKWELDGTQAAQVPNQQGSCLHVALAVEHGDLTLIVLHIAARRMAVTRPL